MLLKVCLAYVWWVKTDHNFDESGPYVTPVAGFLGENTYFLASFPLWWLANMVSVVLCANLLVAGIELLIG